MRISRDCRPNQVRNYVPGRFDGVSINAEHRRMKILLVQDTDWLTRNIHQHHHVGERLCLRGHELLVIDHDVMWRAHDKRKLFSRRQVFDGVSKTLSNVGVTVIRPGILRVPFLVYISMLFTYSREISAQLKKSPPDLIIGMYVLTSYLALRASKKHGIPFVFEVLEPYSEMIPSTVLQTIGKQITKRIYRGADRVIVINEGLREHAIGMGADPEMTCVIRAGVDKELFGSHVDGQAVRLHYGMAEHEKVLLFMGWLYHFSGLKELLTELAKRGREDFGVKLLIVGDGDVFEELQRMRTDLGLEDCVTLTGKQPYERMPEFIAASDICLLPAYNNKVMRDIVPIKMYEYMTMGKPVIATRLPGIMKEFGSDNGVLWIERPEDALGKALQVIKAGTIEAHGEKARQFVRDNDWGTVVDQSEDVLFDCVQPVEDKDNGGTISTSVITSSQG
jgi:glycosyltransferase involved in cell wall biosynthesis